MKEALEFNLPTVKADRQLVATSNGGLKYPSVLVFDSDWDSKKVESRKKTFTFPSVRDVQRPANEEDIAFMSVSSLHFFFSSTMFG